MENEIKYRPILFSTPMVQAINGGRKNQTRREVKPMSAAFDVAMNKDGSGKWPRNLDEDERWISDMKCPYGKIGDILWVRESCCYVLHEHAHDLLEGSRERNQWVYKASVHEDWMKYAKEKYGYKWKPSIHMPKEACRIFLKITNIKIERLQDISEEDSKLEGIKEFTKDDTVFKFGLNGWEWGNMPRTAIGAFCRLWQLINGMESWDSNPWVWVIEFEKIEKPEDWK